MERSLEWRISWKGRRGSLRSNIYGKKKYDISADGQRFLTIAPAEDEYAAPPVICVVENWFAEFKDREQD